MKGSAILSLFKGCATALITPFKDGKIDYVSMGKIIENQIKEGVDALVVCGTTGEASTLSDKEKFQLVKFTVDLVRNRIPVIAGAGSNDTQHAINLSKEMETTGASGLLIVTPYYNKCSEKGLITHYEKIADSVEIPIVMYSVPSRTGVNIKPNTVNTLSKHPNIVGIKEASGNISQICEIASYISDEFDLYSGNDDQTIPIMSLGGVGCISTVSNIIPRRFTKMIHDYLDGNYIDAGSEQVVLKPLIDSLFEEVNPGPVKAAMNMLGHCNLEYRLPMCIPTNKTQFLIYDALEEFGLI